MDFSTAMCDYLPSLPTTERKDKMKSKRSYSYTIEASRLELEIDHDGEVWRTTNYNQN